MKNDFDLILIEIESIIAKIGSYTLSDTERSSLDLLFKIKMRQATELRDNIKLKLAS